MPAWVWAAETNRKDMRCTVWKSTMKGPAHLLPPMECCACALYCFSPSQTGVICAAGLRMYNLHSSPPTGRALFPFVAGAKRLRCDTRTPYQILAASLVQPLPLASPSTFAYGRIISRLRCNVGKLLSQFSPRDTKVGKLLTTLCAAHARKQWLSRRY